MKKKKVLISSILLSIVSICFACISNVPSQDCNTKNIIKNLANSTFSNILSANSAFAAGHAGVLFPDDDGGQTYGEPIVLNLAGGG